MTAVGKVIDLVSSRKFVTIDQTGRELESCGYSLDIVNDAVNKALEDSRLKLENRSNVKGNCSGELNNRPSKLRYWIDERKVSKLS